MTVMRACFAALFLAAGALELSGCATNSYVGIPLAPRSADPELQDLARRAQAGDKQAQLELGIRFEEGRGVAADLERAKKLYEAAAGSAGGTLLVYAPGANGRPGQWIPMSSGRESAGLPAAYLRLIGLDRTKGWKRVVAELTARDLSDPEICATLKSTLQFLVAAPPTECMAYPFDVKPKAGRAFVAYDLAVSISFEDSTRLDYPTNLVDPLENNLIGTEGPVRGRLTYLLMPGAGGNVAVIHQFEPF